MALESRPLRRVARALSGVTALALGAAASIVSASACGSGNCSVAERTYSGGTRSRAGCVLKYETSLPVGPYLAFEGGADYHVKHGLGVVPWETHVDLSFNERPEDASGGGAAAAAGNQALLLRQTADEVQIKNDTCSAFWMCVTVTALDTTSPGCATSTSSSANTGTP
jgi:hypothetical protein